jgi:nickel/cobalt transporter (NicO) family protein
MHGDLGPISLLIAGAAAVGVIHSVLPDHWVPLAVVARTERWSLLRVGRVSLLAAGGHVLTSVVIGGVVALVGLQFQKQIETQQGHIVGGVLVLTGLGFLVWGLTGHGHAHDHGVESEHVLPSEHRSTSSEGETHDHQHSGSVAPAAVHTHEHTHSGKRHTHRHSHEAFVQARAELIATRSSQGTLVGHLAAIAVPFGVAASPDLSFLPLGLAASAYGAPAVTAVLAAFAAFTVATFVGLTVVATAVGYQMRGEWLEKHANSITSLVLVGIGVVALFGF